jgi:hypothetical protein
MKRILLMVSGIFVSMSAGIAQESPARSAPPATTPVPPAAVSPSSSVSPNNESMGARRPFRSQARRHHPNTMEPMASPGASVSNQSPNRSPATAAQATSSESPEPIQPRHHRMRRRPFLPPGKRPGGSEGGVPGSPAPATQPNNSEKSPAPSTTVAPSPPPKP